MKTSLVTRLSFMVILNIICNGDCANQFRSTVERKNIHKLPKSLVVKYDNWICESITVPKTQLERVEGPSASAKVENVYRKARSVESKNPTNTSSSTVEHQNDLHENFKRSWPVLQWKEHGFFNDNYLNLINDHWLRFPPPSGSLHKTLGGFYVLFSTVGCWGNITVLFMYLSVSVKDYTDNILKNTGSNSVNLKVHSWHSIFSWRRLDTWKQWKRRRRMALYYGQDIKTKDGGLKKAHAVDFSSYETSLDLDMKNVSKETENVIKKFKERWPIQAWRDYGLFTDDYLLLINRHWLQFPPPDPVFHYTLGGTYIVMTSIGCFGNLTVLLMYIRCRTLRTPGNILVANLALSDFFMLAKTPIFIFNSFNLGPALGETGCVIYGFLGGLTGTTSIATLSAIALDRYWAVVRPLEPLRALTAIRARLLAIGAWLYAGLFAIIPALNIGYGRYVPEGFLTSCSFDYLTEEVKPRIFIFVFFCAAWLAPFCTISFCYISIFRVVTCNRNIASINQEQRLSSRHVKERTKRKAEIKLAFLVMAVIVLFFVSWTPYAVVALLGIFGKKDVITPISSMIPALFCKTAAGINPFIYIITHPTFRKEFKKLLFRDKAKRMRGTFKTIGYYTETSKNHRPSRDLSDTDVEIVEMKDIPFQSGSNMKTLSSRVAERQDSQRSCSMKSLEENIVSPPSWFIKPQFSKKRSFRRHSTRSVISQNTDPTA